MMHYLWGQWSSSMTLSVGMNSCRQELASAVVQFRRYITGDQFFLTYTHIAKLQSHHTNPIPFLLGKGKLSCSKTELTEKELRVIKVLQT